MQFVSGYNGIELCRGLSDSELEYCSNALSAVASVLDLVTASKG